MLTCFLPCRRGSQRVVNKNTRAFAGHEDGLLGIKLRQLMEVECDEIVVSSNDELVLDISRRVLASGRRKFRVLERPDELGSNTTSTDELIRYVPQLVDDGDVLWTHVTSPFVGPALYERAIADYYAALQQGTHDSLAAATLRQTFMWNDKGPVNYDRSKERWPRTQTLEQWWEINSAIFIAPIATYRELGDRIGERLLLWELDELAGMEIDREPQFHACEELMKAGVVTAAGCPA